MYRLDSHRVAALRKHALASGLEETFQGTPLRSSRDPDSGDVVVTAPGGAQTRFAFDKHGFFGSTLSPLGRLWQMENDERGKLRSFREPGGARLDLSYSHEGSPRRLMSGPHSWVEFIQDSQGRLSQIRHPDDTARCFQYSQSGHLCSIINRLGHEERYEHDDEGLLRSIVNAKGIRTRFEYGSWSRPDRAIRPDGGIEHFEYDLAGRVRKIAFGRNATQLSYDVNGQLADIIHADGEVIKLRYDEQGRLIEARCSSSCTRYAYDERGRIKEECQDGQTVRYEHDERDALVALVWPSGARAEFRYDADGRPASIQDWEGGVHRFEYGADERSWVQHSPNGVRTIISNSAPGLVKSIRVQRSATSPPLFSLEYEHDAERRIRVLTDSEFGRREFSLDAEGQLLAVRSSRPNQCESFAYDLAGNRTRCNQDMASHDSMDRLLSQGDDSFSYDERGNLVLWQSPRGQWRYQYDSRNLMTLAEGPGGRRVSFGYDAFGRRLWKRTNEAETRYLWAGEHLIGETVQGRSGVHVRQLLYIPGTYTPLATRLGGRVYCHHTDHLGTPRRLTDEFGRVAWAADYGAYGEARIGYDGVSNPIRLPGQYFDEETGLHYNRFRYYSPGLGRYLGCDPASWLGGLNAYTYARNDPMNSADPLGLWDWKTVVSIGAAVVAGVAVSAAIILTAPVSLPAMAVTAAAVIAGGAAAGAVGFGLNEALNQEKFCLTCTLKEMGRGALIGGLAALPFAFLPATAGVLAFMGAGGASGAIGYVGDWITNPGASWDWTAFAASVGLGVATAGLARYLIPKVAGRIGRPRSPAPRNTGASSHKPVRGREGLGKLAGREIRVSEKGLKKVEDHLNRNFLDADGKMYKENQMMIERLRAALSEGRKISGGDASFYLHELAESTMMSRGLSYDAAHAQALAKYGVSPFSVYHPEVIQKLYIEEGAFNSKWLNFWGLNP